MQGDVWLLVWVPAAVLIIDIVHMLVKQLDMFSQKCLFQGWPWLGCVGYFKASYWKRALGRAEMLPRGTFVPP